MSNNLDQGQLEDRARSLVLSGHDHGFGSSLNPTAVDLLGDDDADAPSGLRAPVAVANVQDLMTPARRLSTGSASRTAGETGEDSSDDSDSGSQEPGKGKWFDVASETQRFKRRADTSCTKIKARMEALIQQMQGQLDVSRNMMHEDLVETEIVHHRLQALRIIATKPQSEYSAYLESIAATLVCIGCLVSVRLCPCQSLRLLCE